MDTPNWLFKAFVNSPHVLTSERFIIPSSCNEDLFLDAVATRLIQNVGRFVESHASDFLIWWKLVKELTTAEALHMRSSGIVVFALHKQGVDSNNVFEHHLREEGMMHGIKSSTEVAVSPGYYYRKVLAVRVRPVEDCDSSYVEVELRDLSSVLFRLPAATDNNT